MKKVISLALLGALLLSGCGQSDKPLPTSTKVQPASTKEVYIMAGKVDTKEQAAVNTKISAKVAQILVDVGSVVKKGDPVIILDTNDISAQVKQAEAAVSTAQANLDNVLAGSRPEQVSQAQAALDSAKESYNTVKSNFDRIQELYNQGGASRQQFEAAQTQLSTTEAQYKSAQNQLDMLKNGATKEAVSIMQNLVQQAQAALDVAKTQLNNGTILAPISGTVVAKTINVGELASPSTALLSIMNSGDLYVNAYLPASMVEQVSPGQQAIVKISELPDKKFEGEIDVVNSAINSVSKNILVKVALKSPDPLLKPGMFAEVSLKK